MDLMQAQHVAGNRVAMLWPGRMHLSSPRSRILEHRLVDGIGNLELVNPLPVPLDEGIADVAAYTAPREPEPFEAFFACLAPDVLHVHTLMGLPVEALQAAKRQGIRIVFSSHDFFGICPRVTLFRDGHACEDDDGCARCAACNRGALSLAKIRLLQSPAYRLLKDAPWMRALRRRHRRGVHAPEIPQSLAVSTTKTAPCFQALRTYYMRMFALVDAFHFNSTLTRDVYRRYIDAPVGAVLPATHAGLRDHRRQKAFSDSLRIAYMGPCMPYKGFFALKAALDAAYAAGRRDFTLDVFAPCPAPSPYMRLRDAYRHADLPEIFGRVDLLVAPSQCYETFGLTVAEALSHAVPVLATEHVGAKDLLGDGAYGWVVPTDGLTRFFLQQWPGPDQLAARHAAICEGYTVQTIEEHLAALLAPQNGLYYPAPTSARSC